MRVLVTGGGGYIGIPLIEALLERGDEVVCLDRFFFGEDLVSKLDQEEKCLLIKDDIRWFDPKILTGVDIVIDLASISNDPAGELNPVKTMDINFLGRLRVAKLAKEYGVKRYILASTCSVYGFNEELIDESSAPNPLTTYAKAAVLAERDILPLASSNFTVICPRFATVYGYGPRMRFDLAINAMILRLYKTSKLPIMRDGNQWRPFIHVKDVARAYLLLSESPSDKVNGQIYNIGSDKQNYQIYPLAKELGDSMGKPYEIDWYGDVDKRSYRVSFKKIKDALGFDTQYTPSHATAEIMKALENGSLVDDTRTRTVEWYKHLLSCEALVKAMSSHDTIL
jgi:nucleoside-diphosphate-sugar epimerase